MWAAEKGNIGMVELLLEKGADPNLAAKVCIMVSKKRVEYLYKAYSKTID